jgi:hypothetical protein
MKIKHKITNTRLWRWATRHKKISIAIILIILLAYPAFKYVGFFKPTISIEEKPRVVIFLMDGAVGDIVYEMAESNELSNIKKHLYDRGTVVLNAQTVFPTVTGTAHIPILTGEGIEKHNIPGLRWFKREELIYRDYVGPGAAYINYEMGNVKMLGELFPDKKIFFVFEAINKGIFELYPLDIEIIPMKTGWHQLADKAAVDGAMTRFIPGRKPPDITLIWFPGPDKAIHHYGPSSQGYRDELVYVDRQIGRFIDRLKSLGIYEETTLILVSDHGGYDTGNHDVLADFFKERGFEVLNLGIPQSFLPDLPYLAVPMSYPKEVADLIDWSISPKFEIVVAVTGNGMAFIYVKDTEEGWKSEPGYSELRSYGRGDVDLIEELIGRESVDLVFARDREAYYIFSQRGSAKFDKREDGGEMQFQYTVSEGKDPLGYSEYEGAGFLIGKWVSSDDWFEATHDLRYPNTLYHVHSVFESDRTGDLIATANDGWSFRVEIPEEFHGDHGPPTRSNIIVPLIVTGPQFKHKFVEKGKTSDVVNYITVALDVE